MLCLTTLIVALASACWLTFKGAQYRRTAHTDALTGVANRRAANRALFASRPAPACVALVDLDDLRARNKAHGHAAGDRLLRAAAGALVDVALPGDTVARVGGDEFLLIASAHPKRGAEGLELRIGTAMAAAGVGASVGAAEVTADTDVRAALALADRRAIATKRGRARSAATSPDAGECRGPAEVTEGP